MREGLSCASAIEKISGLIREDVDFSVIRVTLPFQALYDDVTSFP